MENHTENVIKYQLAEDLAGRKVRHVELDTAQQDFIFDILGVKEEQMYEVVVPKVGAAYVRINHTQTFSPPQFADAAQFNSKEKYAAIFHRGPYQEKTEKQPYALLKLKNRILQTLGALGISLSIGCDGQTQTPAAPFPQYMDGKSIELRAKFGASNAKIEKLLTAAETAFVRTLQNAQACNGNQPVISLSSFPSRDDAKIYASGIGLEAEFTYTCMDGQANPKIKYIFPNTQQPSTQSLLLNTF